MWKLYKKRNSFENTENPYWLSISDLMTGLLMIFMLALSFYILNYTQKTVELAGNLIKRAQILKFIQDKLEAQGIQVKVDIKHGILHLPEGILFDQGEAKLKPNGIKLLKRLGPILYEVLTNPEFKGSVETIFIEGHTDNVPIFTSKFPSNWELSTQRAINTWRELRKIQPQLTKLKNSKGEPIFSCSGYADTRPIASNDTPEGRRENRRIDFRFTMVSPKLKEASLVHKINKTLENLK